MIANKTKKIYLDYAATTPVDPAVFRAMRPYFAEKFGNPGSLHRFGQEAIAAVDRSRETIAKSIGADFREVIFTASATEANNLALRGAVSCVKRQASSPAKPSIIISSIEHESVLETARALEKEGAHVVYLPVDRDGIVDLKILKESLTSSTVLVSVMHANNEIGTIQPIAEIAKILKDFREARDKGQETRKKSSVSHVPCRLSQYPLLHSDCSQSFQFLDCNAGNLGIDLMTLSAHKIYGPKGAGALYVGHGTGGRGQVRNTSTFSMSHVSCLMSPVLVGGGQEFGLRSGTENVPAIVGFAKAAELITFSRSHERESVRMENMRDQLWKGIKKICPGVESNTPCLVPHVPCLPNLLNVYFPNHDAQDLLTRFDLQGLAVSSGSACRSRAMESSHVIEALGYSKERPRSSIRFSLGRPTAKQEIAGALEIIKKTMRP